MQNSPAFLKNINMQEGELGLLLGERGAGKTSCLINIGIEGMFKGESVLHVSLDDLPDRVESHYEVKIKEAISQSKTEKNKFHDIDLKKTILSYMNQSFDLEKLAFAINNLGSSFGIMLIDGIEDIDINIFKGIKNIAMKHYLKTWISYPTRKYLDNEKDLSRIFDFILELHADHEKPFILIKKTKDKTTEELKLELNPVTFFVK